MRSGPGAGLSALPLAREAAAPGRPGEGDASGTRPCAACTAERSVVTSQNPRISVRGRTQTLASLCTSAAFDQ